MQTWAEPSYIVEHVPGNAALVLMGYIPRVTVDPPSPQDPAYVPLAVDPPGPQDPAYVPLAVDPPGPQDPAYVPLADAGRLQAVDLLRGFAVLGILLVNMQLFAMPNAASVNPYALAQPSAIDLAIWSVIHLLFDTKLVTIFSMLFGAGVVLMTDRLDRRGVSSGRLHYRRMLWLLAFGLFHAYVLWHGDILVLYAVCGMLVYPARRFQSRTLVAVGLALLAIATTISLAAGLSWRSWPVEAAAEWQQYWQPPQTDIAAETAAFRGDWLEQESWRATYSAEFHLQDMMMWDVWRVGGLMLLGMALLKSDVLTGRRTQRYYAALTAIGFGSGLPLVAWGLHRFHAVGWSLPDAAFLVPLWNYWGSILVALGYMGLLLSLWKAAAVPTLVARLASVGRAAFSCYILETLICTTIYYGHGLGLFGTVDRLQQLVLTVAVWIVIVILAPLWLRHFRYGPLEWLWRRLTYGSAVPLRREAFSL